MYTWETSATPLSRSHNTFCKESESKYFGDYRPHKVIFVSSPSLPPPPSLLLLHFLLTIFLLLYFKNVKTIFSLWATHKESAGQVKPMSHHLQILLVWSKGHTPGSRSLWAPLEPADQTELGAEDLLGSLLRVHTGLGMHISKTCQSFLTTPTSHSPLFPPQGFHDLFFALTVIRCCWQNN